MTLQQKSFCKYCEIFKSAYFEEHLRKAASASSRFSWVIPNSANRFPGCSASEEM